VREAVDERPSGQLRIGAGESSIRYLLPQVVRRFRKKHPQVDLTLVNQSYDESLTMLRDGSVDLAVRSLSRPAPGIVTQPLRAVRRVFIASRREGPTLSGKPTLAQLSEHPFVLPWRGSKTRALLETALAAEGLRCRVSLEAGRWETVKLYVVQGLGIGLVPEIVVEQADQRHLTVRPASHLFAAEQYGVLLLEDRPRSLAIKAVLDLLNELGPESARR
jgi:DNA-binding transcriptional LysR family regulator